MLFRSEQWLNFLGEKQSAYEHQRDRETSEKSKPCIDGEQNDKDSCKRYKVCHDIWDDMSVKQLKIPGVTDDTAHQVSGLFVMKERQIKSLHFVIDLFSHIADKIPGSSVCHVIAQKSENNSQQVKRKYPDSEIPDSCKIRLSDSFADEPSKS